MLELSQRERHVLRSVLHSFILNANPVGSRSLSKQYDLGLSPATIRNTMADLEEMGLLEQPHTSAGRQPTKLAYRVYVDQLMEERKLTLREKKLIDESVFDSKGNVSIILRHASALLGRMSNLLGVVISPKFEKGILHKIDLTKIAEGKIMVILTIKSGLVKTITLEINFFLNDDDIDRTTRILNQRLAGLTLAEIRSNISDRIQELPPESRRDLITLFVEKADSLFDFEDDHQFYLTGLKTLIEQPEFSKTESLRTIIELMEDQKVLVHLIGSGHPEEGVKVKIGEDTLIDRQLDISVITSAFYIGNNIGRIGVIGPTRVDYSKLLSIVDYTAKAIDKHFR